MNHPAAAASSIRGSTDLNTAEELQTLRTGLELARASHLTMLRLQLALHKSNRRTAMQALDDLLEIDAKMEGLAATLNGVPTDLTGDAPLFGFIGFQKEAIAAEKHVLASGGLRFDAEPLADSPPDEGQRDAGPAEQALLSDGDAESSDRVGRRLWMYVLAVVIVMIVLGCGLIAYLWPELPTAVMSF